jgi:hypothetical protein
MWNTKWFVIPVVIVASGTITMKLKKESKNNVRKTLK